MYPTPHTVTHSRRVTSGANALGQAVVTYQTVSRKVYGWSSNASTDVATDGGNAVTADRTITELSLLTPDGDWADGDKVNLPDGREFTVVGEPRDSNTGPFGFTPGYRVTLRRVHDG